MTTVSGRNILLVFPSLGAELSMPAKTAKQRCSIDNKHTLKQGRLYADTKAEFHDMNIDFCHGHHGKKNEEEI